MRAIARADEVGFVYAGFRHKALLRANMLPNICVRKRTAARC
jgi:hypothetical protein